MWEANTEPPKTWKQELATLVDYTGTMTFDDGNCDGDGGSADGSAEKEALSWSEAMVVSAQGATETITEFAKGVGEMSVELVRSFLEVAKQSLEDKDSFVARKVGKPCRRICERLSFLNEYLPEDRDPFHSWSVIVSVFLVAFLALSVNSSHDTAVEIVKNVHIHPPNASRILLRDGRHLAYHEQGVPADLARFTIIVPHSFLYSRLAGIPGLKTSLMEEFGVRVITYDLPGFGESDPHPHRSLESSAVDMSHLADALEVNQKFWVFGHSDGTINVWAALRYIPDKLAGVAVFAPMVNPYDPSMTKEERSRTWEKWSSKRKLMYICARRFPRFLRYFYYRTFLSGKHGPIDQWLSLSLGKRDRALIEDPRFEAFWQRNVEESIRQGDVKAFVEEAALQVSNWDFNIADLQAQDRSQRKGFLLWLKSIYSYAEEELTGFLGPIHIWQGMDDGVVPPSMTRFLRRILPGASVHMLPNDGHLTYYYFCDECHKQIFGTLFGTPKGPISLEQAAVEAKNASHEVNGTNEDPPPPPPSPGQDKTIGGSN
ncbi:hypothetical protein Dimus_011510 [Dionaea muscipula]